jgi:predicted ATP-dependent protease
MKELEEKVQEKGFLLNVSQQGMMIVPARDGEPMKEEDLKNLSDEEKENLRRTSEALHEDMNLAAMKIRQVEREVREEHHELDRSMVLGEVKYLFDDLKERYGPDQALEAYLDEALEDVANNLGDFKEQEEQKSPFPIPQQGPDFLKYKVNVFIDNTELEGAPVVFEANPTYTNLFGVIEKKSSFGAMYTDFTMVKAGSLHRANGGYLFMHARDLLKWYLSYEGLKRSLRNKKIVIEDQAEMLGLVSAKSIKPAPISLKIKIILIGEPFIYQILYSQDDQFQKLFKIKAHLDDQIDRNAEEIRKYAGFAARVVGQDGLLDVDKTGLARLLEYGAEVAGRQSKLTLKMAQVQDILREADVWARDNDAALISRDHVDQAIRHRKYRSSLPEDRLQEYLLEGYINVATTGLEIGQINGLSVYDLGDYQFGRPSRITASVAVGRKGVVNIDRESKLSGNLHTKGLLIMESYLRSLYAVRRPLSLAASLVFEQSYGRVDGDSASAAELFALLSELAQAPIRQGLAVTGSISQFGEIQPIGGVNQKIEGFFDLCQARGLTGEQGVIVPRANLKDLMLKGQVVNAVDEGRFKIWAVGRAEEALEILTDVPAGQRDESGRFPEGTLHRRVADRLEELADRAKKQEGNEKNQNNDSGDEPSGCEGCDR